ncbi:PIR protein, pseudogene, putative [Plasmodium sp.]|nr:PIR protein, pseudogene, putative [Plasmodium sp.]
MNIYFLHKLQFLFLINTFVLLCRDIFQWNNYNIRFTQTITQQTTIKSRVLAQTQNHNPHYHNDPELKEIIDKLNEEAIKKYQESHDPYEQLQELIEKNGTKTRGGNGVEPMLTIGKELLVTYEEMFDDENHVKLKSGMYTNEDIATNYKNNKSCKYENKKSSDKLYSSNKVRDNYIDNLKAGCIGSTGTCVLSSIITGSYGIVAGAAAAKGVISAFPPLSAQITSALIGVKFFSISLLEPAIKSLTPPTYISLLKTSGTVGSAVTTGTAAFFPYGMTIVVLIVVTIIVIILYLFLRKRRKNSWKHEWKKHLCT